MRALAGLLLCAGIAAGKPRSVCVDGTMKTARIVAEVEILEVKKLRERQWVIQVRVTDRPDRVFVGFAYLGTELAVRPSGYATRAGDSIAKWKRAGSTKRVLMVLDAERVLLLAGRPMTGGEYRLRGWYDFNACWLYSSDPKFGRRLDGRHGDGQFQVAAPRIRALFRPRRAAFWARVSRFLSGEEAALDEARIDQLIAALQDPNRPVRTKAHSELVAGAGLAVGTVRSRLAGIHDPEARRRVQAVLAALAPYETARRVSLELPQKHHAYVLREGLVALDGLAARHARERLAKLRRNASTDARTPR